MAQLKPFSIYPTPGELRALRRIARNTERSVARVAQRFIRMGIRRYEVKIYGRTSIAQGPKAAARYCKTLKTGAISAYRIGCAATGAALPAKRLFHFLRAIAGSRREAA